MSSDPLSGDEAVSCVLCPASTTRRVIEKHGYPVVRCRGCGLVFAARRPAADRISALYADPSYFRGRRYYLDYLGSEAGHRRLARELLGALTRHGAEGRLLDVGCAAGFLLDEARSAGFRAAGVELSPRLAAVARGRGFEVREGELAAAGFEPACFDAIVLADSLEHVIDPVATLVEARRVAAAGALILILTPNVESRLARLLGRRWPHYTPPEHLWYFAPSTLERVLGEAGFSVLEQSSSAHWFRLGELVAKALPERARGRWLPRALPFELRLNVGDLLVIGRARRPLV